MNKKKKALITGVTGQDGAYLSEFLLGKGYEVHGMKRRSSLINTARIDHLYEDFHKKTARFFLHYGDMTDAANLIRLIQKIQPDEIYNLAAQSHVKVSFDMPAYTTQADALGTLHILEALRILGLEKKTRFYQAASSEMYGNAKQSSQNEDTPFAPRSPYAAAKLYAYWVTINYREAYGMFACNGILFNHESPLRGETFVTRKITRAVAAIHHGYLDRLYIGNLDARRDWGYAGDYVEGMWLMLQRDKPEDFVLATGRARSVREFTEKAFGHVGITLQWQGKGAQEKGLCAKTGRTLVEVDPVYFRPAEVDFLQGDASKAKENLGWQPRTDFDGLVGMMVDSDLENIRPEQFGNIERNTGDVRRRGKTL